MNTHKPAETPFDAPAYVQSRLEELREWRSQEQRGYTRSVYDGQIEELEKLQDEAGWPTAAISTEPTQPPLDDNAPVCAGCGESMRMVYCRFCQ